MTHRHAHIDTAIGELLLVADDDALCGLYFPQHWYPPAESEIGVAVQAADDALFAATAAQLAEYLAGQRQTFTISVETNGDAFSERVWSLLREIPYGQTTTYGALAAHLGNRGLAQRVGQAVGHNPVSILIPCHRVVGADGSLTGFAGGLPRKRQLLDLEESEDLRSQRLF